jgi:hypothetical protein
MSEPNEDFEKDLEQLIRLFKKIKDKSKAEHFSNLDPAFAQNLDFIINNYEMVKNNIPKEMFTQMGLPFQQMMREFIRQLKTELGEDFVEDDLMNEEEDLVEDSNKNDAEDQMKPSDEIAKIDAALKKPGLTNEQIDKLLDRRNYLLNT